MIGQSKTKPHECTGLCTVRISLHTDECSNHTLLLLTPFDKIVLMHLEPKLMGDIGAVIQNVADPR